MNDRVLLTGITGYLALHVARELLARGYTVRGTLRTPSRAEEVRAALRPAGGQLELVEAELTADAGWTEASHDCRFVLHVASPLVTKPPKHDDELVIPSRDGTMRVLRAAHTAGVERVVLTSSTGAVVSGHPKTRTTAFTEADWTIPETAVAYSRSKLFAEQAAWAFAKQHGLALVTLAPPFILGPLLSSDPSTSLELVRKPLRRDLPGCPRIDVPLADVRDLAKLHVDALTAEGAVGERFLCGAGRMWYPELVALLAKTFPERKIRTMTLPSALVRVASWVDPVLQQILPDLDRPIEVDSRKAERVLGWAPRGIEETILDTARDLIDRKLV